MATEPCSGKPAASCTEAAENSGTTAAQKTRKKTKKPKKQKRQEITFSIRRDEAIVFRAYAKSQGRTVRGLLVEFIRACNKSFPGAAAVLQDPAAEQMSFDDFGDDGEPEP